MVAATRAQLIKVPFACVGGGCGFCKARVTDGQYRLKKYAKSALTDEEAKVGYVLLCKAHPINDLQIELNS